MAKLAFVAVTAIMLVCWQENESTLSIARSQHVHSKDQGICPFAMLVGHNGPVAVFGVYKTKNGRSKFGYLILIEPQPDRERAVELTIQSKEGTTSETRTNLTKQLKWEDKTIEVAWNLTTDDRSGRIDNNVFRVDSKIFDTKSRLLLAKRVGDKFEYTAVKDVMPAKVPDATNDDDWAKDIQAAIEELKSSSKQVAGFLKKS